MTKFKIFASVIRYTFGIIEGILINLAANGVMYYMGNFFASYQFYTMIVIFLFSIVVVWWLERIGINDAILHAIIKKHIRTETVTQPAKLKQQLDNSPLSKFLKDASKNRKEFEKRSNEIAKNISRKE
jgi:hypothetical protein